jgi:N-acyl-D-amino-acid deacylase
MYDVLVKNGRVVDGTGNPWFRADVAVKAGRITRVQRHIEGEAGRVIDAADKVVCPGFIDIHTHSDRTALVHNRADSSVHQGVTTEGVGQCGSSPYPLHESDQKLAQKLLGEACQATPEAVGAVTWTSLSGWRETIEHRGISINLAPYVGHGMIRTYAMGPEGKGGEIVHPTREQMETMKDECARAMEEGAFGLSTGLRYAPGRNATTQEVVELSKVVSRYGGVHISHMRSEEEMLVSAVGELIQISEEARIPSSATHHKAMFPENWGKPNETLRMLDRARQRDIEVMCDQYPWLFSSMSNLNSYFLPVAPDRGAAKDLAHVLTCVKDDATWEKMRAALHKEYEGEVERNERRRRELAPYGIKVPDIWDPAVMKHIAHSPSHPEIDLKSLGEVGRLFRKPDFWDAVRQVYLDDEGTTLLAGGDMCEEDLITIMKWPFCAVSTDSWILNDYPSMLDPRGTPHPRNYGSFPHVLHRYVRELGVLRLEEAVRKMTGLPAEFLGLYDRGLLREGNWADIVVFDPAGVTNNATFAEPRRHPDGIPYVLVNGVVTIDSGKHTGAMSGQVLRNRGR